MNAIHLRCHVNNRIRKCRELPSLADRLRLARDFRENLFLEEENVEKNIKLKLLGRRHLKISKNF